MTNSFIFVIDMTNFVINRLFYLFLEIKKKVTLQKVTSLTQLKLTNMNYQSINRSRVLAL